MGVNYKGLVMTDFTGLIKKFQNSGSVLTIWIRT